MNKIIFSVALVLLMLQSAWAQWSPQGDKIKTPWADKVTPENVWRSYPRPQLQRSEWINLNGLWKYTVTPADVSRRPVDFDGEILVPFAIESSLSGVQRKFLPTDKLWYKREFSLNKGWKGKNIVLHFGAVDYECTVWLNGRLVGNHKGGNNPFSFDITPYLRRSGSQVLELSVLDPTDTKTVTRGKQRIDQGGIMYTPVSGIWKTVWLEPVGDTYIDRIIPEPDIRNAKVRLNLNLSGVKGDEKIKVDLYDDEKCVGSIVRTLGDRIELDVPNAVLWSPASPKLYRIKARLTRGNKLLDEVGSYFALREVSIVKDTCGYNRVGLNGKPIFQYGTLDQGWWPDGLLTPPSEEAMLWDMTQLKAMGFNTIRKHIKVEPELYYYYADSLGLMMWQDMVSGFETERRSEQCPGPYAAKDWNAPVEHARQWEKELFEMIDGLRFYPCITTWVIFNEGWGQYNTEEIVNRVTDYDRSRIVNGVSGWKDRGVGHMFDVHNYPNTCMILPENNGNRISALGEYGGLGWAVQGHLWDPKRRNWGYKNIDGGLSLLENYTRVVYDLEALIAQGLGAAIYTQTTDVEAEVNGLITYDRKVTKLPVKLLHLINSRLYDIGPAMATVLVADGQGGGKNRRHVSVDGKIQDMNMPCAVDENTIITATSRFSIDRLYDHLSLWLNMSASVSVFLNGHLVFEQNIREFRQPTHFNLSDYADLLHLGENELRVEARITKRCNFDYGLRTF